MGDVFTTDEAQSVVLTINGESTTLDVAEGETLMSFVKQHAQSAGIRTFSVYVDGQKATTEQAGRSLNGINSVEIVAKDSRGSRLAA